MTRRDPDEPAPLPGHARDVLARYVDAQRMPPDATRRVEQALRNARRRPPWVAVALLAVAAALLVAWALRVAWQPSALADRKPEHQQASDRPVDETPAEHARIAPTPAELPMPTSAAPTPTPATQPTVLAPRGRAPDRRPRDGEADGPAPDAPAAAEITDAPIVPSGAERLAAERALLASAWRALGDDDLAEALRLVERHREQFARGALVPEREALSAIARCRNDPAQGPEIVAQFARISAPAALRARVRSACDGPR